MDAYTKGVLTVIAVALCVLVVQNAVLDATAVGHDGCGQARFSPCYLDVKVRQ